MEVAVPRIPCRIFAGWLGARGWVKSFTAQAVPGAYLRVIEPGFVQIGSPVTVVHRPDHDITIGFVFRALTKETELLPRLLVADALPDEVKQRARQRASVQITTNARRQDRTKSGESQGSPVPRA